MGATADRRPSPRRRGADHRPSGLVVWYRDVGKGGPSFGSVCLFRDDGWCVDGIYIYVCNAPLLLADRSCLWPDDDILYGDGF